MNILVFLSSFPLHLCLTFLSFLRLFWLLGQRFRWSDIELACWDVDRNYTYFHGLAQAYASPRTLTYDALGFFVVFPLVVSQGGHPDKSFDAELFALYEYTEARQTGHDTVELFADFFAEHLQRKYGCQFSFGVLGPLLGESYMFASLC